MAYSAQHAKYYHSTDGTAYTQVTGLMSIDGPGREARIQEITNLDSTAVPRLGTGVVDCGEITIEVQHIETDTGQIAMDANVGLNTYGRITVDTDADGTADVTWTFGQIVSKWEIGGIEEDGIPSKTYTIAVNGDITEA